MPLPNVNPISPNLRGSNPVDYQATQLARTLKGVNVKFQEFMADLAVRMESVVSPTLGIKSGVYSAFGNNFVTRGGIAAMDSIMSATEGIFGTPEDKKDEPKDPITVAIEAQTKTLSDLITSLRGTGESVPASGFDAYEKQFGEIISNLKRMADKECCDDTEMVSKLNNLTTQVQKIVDILVDEHADEIDKRKHKGMVGNDKLFYDMDKKQLLSLTNISKLLTTHTKILERLPAEPISTIEDVFEAPKQIQTSDYIDVEAKEISDEPEKEESKSGILLLLAGLLTAATGMVKKAGFGIMETISSIVKRISTMFGGKGGTALQKFGSIAPSLMGGKAGKIASMLGIGAGVYAAADAKEVPKEEEQSADTSLSIPPIVPLGSPKTLPTPDTKPVPKESRMAKIGKGLAKGLRFLPGIGLAIAGADAAYSAFSGVQEAGKIFGTDQTSLSQEVSAGIGGIAEGVTFGLLDKESVAKKTQGLYESMTNSDANKQREIDRLEKQIEDQKSAPKSSSGDAPNVFNNVTNNTQNFMSSRKYVENNDASYRRYIDSVFKTC